MEFHPLPAEGWLEKIVPSSDVQKSRLMGASDSTLLGDARKWNSLCEPVQQRDMKRPTAPWETYTDRVFCNLMERTMRTDSKKVRMVL